MPSGNNDRLALTIDSLAQAVTANTSEMKALRDAIDDLRTEYEHAVRKGIAAVPEQLRPDESRAVGLTPEQLTQAIVEGVAAALSRGQAGNSSRGEEIQETIACAHCDIDSPPSLAAALQEGWTQLQRDDGSGWNYLGVCPACQERLFLEDSITERAQTGKAGEKEQKQKGLF